MDKHWWEEYKYFMSSGGDYIDVVQIINFEQSDNIIWFDLKSMFHNKVDRVSGEELSGCFKGVNELPKRVEEIILLIREERTL